MDVGRAEGRSVKQEITGNSCRRKTQRERQGDRRTAGWGGGREVRWWRWGKQELFNYSTSRQQRTRFQEDITACSPEGKAHLACSPIPYPHKLLVGISNAFLLLLQQTLPLLSWYMSQMSRSATWGSKSSSWQITRKMPPAFNFKEFWVYWDNADVYQSNRWKQLPFRLWRCGRLIIGLTNCYNLNFEIKEQKKKKSFLDILLNDNNPNGNQ